MMKPAWKPATGKILDKNSEEFKTLVFLASAMNLVESRDNFSYCVEDTTLGAENRWTTIVRHDTETGQKELMFTPTSQKQFFRENETNIRLLADKIIYAFNMTEPCLGEVEETFNNK